MDIPNKYRFVDDDEYFRIYTKNDIKIDELYGKVLYLGMGDLYIPRKQPDAVIKTTIVEIDPEVIALNKPKIKPDWEIICEDAYTYKPTIYYDFIVADIWYLLQPKKHMEEFRKLYESYGDKIYFLEKIFIW